MEEVDYLIVGAGLAGRCLAENFIDAGINFGLISHHLPGASTIVSAGIINPITGMRFVRSWNFHVLEEHFKKFYLSLENKLGIHFFKSMQIDQVLKTDFEIQQWLERSADPMYIDFIQSGIFTGELFDGKYYQFGKISRAYLVQLEALMPVWNDRLKENCLYKEQLFTFKNLIFGKEQLQWNNLLIKKGLIFTEGYKVKENPFFNWIPVVPLKGECCTVDVPGNKRDSLLKMNYTLCPLGTSKLWCGASFKVNDHHLGFDENEKINQQQFISITVQEISKSEISFKVGIRPATRDRKPIAGQHPKHKNLYVINGFGTKGFSLAPYVSNCFLDFIQGKAVIPDEISIERLKRKGIWPDELN